MGHKLCVFPNDPLEAYYKKGEIKDRYFNPMNIFDEIHVITLAESEINEDKVQTVAGNAELRIHTTGKINLRNYRKEKDKVLDIVREIKPDIIRAYNPLVAGWLATYCSQKMRVPLVVSLHIEYDRDVRHLYSKDKNYKQLAKFLFTGRFIEPYVLKNANKVICAYDFMVDYAKKHGAKDVQVIYNRVDLKRFSPDADPALKCDKPTIICVGRLIPEKNQECLIRAMKGLDVYLLLIGDGPLYDSLNQLAADLGVKYNVIFLRSVQNSEIHRYYVSADIFALPMKYGGIAIPMLEAMASGLPVVMGKNEWEEKPAVIGDVIMIVDNTPEGFREAFSKLLSDPDKMLEMAKNGLEKVKELDGSIMEQKEATLYKELLNM